MKTRRFKKGSVVKNNSSLGLASVVEDKGKAVLVRQGRNKYYWKRENVLRQANKK